MSGQSGIILYLLLSCDASQQLFTLIYLFFQIVIRLEMVVLRDSEK